MNSAHTIDCYHCNEKVPANSNYSLVIDGQSQFFCCPACLAICETINNAGLGNFYQQRDSKAEKASDNSINLALDDAFIKHFINKDGEKSHCKLFIENMHCTACAWLIEKHLAKLPGIIKAQVNYQDQALFISFLHDKVSLQTIFQQVKNIGYNLQAYQDSQVYLQQQKQAKSLLKRLGISFILMMQVGMLSIALYSGDFFGISDNYQQLLHIFSLIFSLPILYFAATPFFASALIGLRNGTLNMDLNISLAIVGLFASSSYSVLNQQGDIYFDSVAMLCFFILLSRYIELTSRLHLQKDSALLPETAKKRIGDQTHIVSSASIQVGDHLLIEPGDSIAVDGIVIEGNSSCSEAVLNGEAEAVSKNVGDKVFAASFNHNGVLIIQATSCQQQSIASCMKANADSAKQAQSQHRNFAEKISSSFTSIMVLLALATFAYWFSQDNENAYWIALSVLVVSCPCALSLAAPTANSVIQFYLKQAGIFIQSSKAIEKLPEIRDICFDKTGTLTLGQFHINHIDNHSTLGNDQLLAIASSLQIHSKHPVASAFQKAPIAQPAVSIHVHPQLGIEATIEGTSYRIGSPVFCQQLHPNIQAKNSRVVVGLCTNKNFLAWFYLEDQIRDESLKTCQFLQQRQLALHILSGDSSNDVGKVADTLAIKSVHAGLSSSDKRKFVSQLKQQQHAVAMIGDGINDGEVLAEADISITLLDASNWLKNNSDIVLMNNSLSSLITLFNSADKHQRILKQNFAWAIAYNAIAIPFAMAGFLTPLLAAIGMSLSSIAVVLNSQRLRKVTGA
jgi:Cu2+-exporting ATPase